MNTSESALFLKEKLKSVLTDKVGLNKISEGFQRVTRKRYFCVHGKIFPQRGWGKKWVLLPKSCQGGEVSKSFLSASPLGSVPSPLCSVLLSGSQGCPGMFIIRSGEVGQPTCMALLPGCPDEDLQLLCSHDKLGLYAAVRGNLKSQLLAWLTPPWSLMVKNWILRTKRLSETIS